MGAYFAGFLKINLEIRSYGLYLCPINSQKRRPASDTGTENENKHIHHKNKQYEHARQNS